MDRVKQQAHDRPVGGGAVGGEPTARGFVAGQLAILLARTGMTASTGVALDVLDRVCGRSLDFPLGTPPPRTSRLNRDGTPVQFAVTLGRHRSALHVLGDPGLCEGSEIARYGAAEHCIAAVAATLGVEEALGEAAPAIAVATADGADALRTHPDGAFWVGAAFAAHRPIGLRIYVNARWGPLPDRWSRLRRVAAWFGAGRAWQRIESAAPQRLEPLGVSLTLEGRHLTGARIYLTGYGARVDEYAALAAATGQLGFADTLTDFCSRLLGAAVRHPTGTAFWSAGLDDDGSVDPKLELCCHCLFPDDATARGRLVGVLDAAALPREPYGDLVTVVSESLPSRRSVDVHCVAGVGNASGGTYVAVYVQPTLVRRP